MSIWIALGLTLLSSIVLWGIVDGAETKRAEADLATRFHVPPHGSFGRRFLARCHMRSPFTRQSEVDDALARFTESMSQ